MRGLLLLFLLVVALVMAEGAIGQDPGEIDSLAFGNFDGSPIAVNIDTDVAIPIWIKCDENIAFVHLCMATENEYVTARLGGSAIGPMLEWSAFFTEPADGWPEVGQTSQSVVGIADYSLPEPNYINTGYEWVMIGALHIHTTDNPDAMGQQSPLLAGEDPMQGLTVIFDQFWSPIVPATVFSQLQFEVTNPPIIISPIDDTLFALNGPFPFTIPFMVSDDDLDPIIVHVDFPYNDYDLVEIVNNPGYVHYQFDWTPSESLEVGFPANFIATDVNNLTDINSVSFEVGPVEIFVNDDTTFPGYPAEVEVSLVLDGYNSNIGGLNLLFIWDDYALSLDTVVFLESLDDWEYKNVSLDPVGPGSVRLVGLANLSSGDVEPLRYGDHPIASLSFMTPADPGIEGLTYPLIMPADSISDNVLSDSSGYMVFHPTIDEGSITFLSSGDFLIGDINLNGFAWEVGDAVVFVEHLIDPVANPFNATQRIASDCNQDGVPETIADLIFLLGMIGGDIDSGFEGSPPGAADISLSIEGNLGTVLLEADAPAAGALVKISHHGIELEDIQTLPGLELRYSDVDGFLTAVIYSPDNEHVITNAVLSFKIVAGGGADISIESFEVSDAFGQLFAR